MPSQKDERAKVVQMTEQQPKTPQIIDIVEMPPTQNGYWFFFYDSGKQIVYDVRHVAQGFSSIQM
jgi:hypothetical protein